MVALTRQLGTLFEPASSLHDSQGGGPARDQAAVTQNSSLPVFQHSNWGEAPDLCYHTKIIGFVARYHSN